MGSWTILDVLSDISRGARIKSRSVPIRWQQRRGGVSELAVGKSIAGSGAFFVSVGRRKLRKRIGLIRMNT